MTATGYYRELRESARSAHDAGRYEEAALLTEQAYRIVRQQNLEEKAFDAGFWAAVRWNLAGKRLRALSIMTEILTAVSPAVPPQLLYASKQLQFHWALYSACNLSRARELAEDLRAMASADNSLALSDVFLCEAEIEERCGNFSGAVELLERAAAHYNSNSTNAKFWIASSAVEDCLFLSRIDDALSWYSVLQAAAKAEDRTPSSRYCVLTAAASIALCEGRFDAADQLAAELESFSKDIQEPLLHREIALLRARTLLLTTSGLNPLAKHHPARARVRVRWKGYRSPGQIFERKLTILDYYLAAVRFSCGMEAIDDYYHRPSSTPVGTLQVSFPVWKALLRRTRRAASAATDAADSLDTSFCCTWRGSVVLDRITRLSEIITAVSDCAQPT